MRGGMAICDDVLVCTAGVLIALGDSQTSTDGAVEQRLRFGALYRGGSVGSRGWEGGTVCVRVRVRVCERAIRGADEL